MDSRSTLWYKKSKNRLTDRLDKESRERDLLAPHIPMTGDDIVDIHVTWVCERPVTKVLGPSLMERWVIPSTRPLRCMRHVHRWCISAELTSWPRPVLVCGTVILASWYASFVWPKRRPHIDQFSSVALYGFHLCRKIYSRPNDGQLEHMCDEKF
jgi:hypothetical protein